MLSFRKNLPLLLLIVIFAFGFFFHILPATRSQVLKLTDFFLVLVNGIFILYLVRKNRSLRFYLWMLITMILTFLVESKGVETGSIFGEYWYGETMRWKIGTVPFIIAVNWAMLILASYSLSGNYTSNKIQRVVLGAVFIVIFDIFMEPVAMKLDYWQWKNDTVPVENYGAWFLLAFLLMHFLSILKIEFRDRLIEAYFIVQLVFFILLGIFYP